MKTLFVSLLIVGFIALIGSGDYLFSKYPLESLCASFGVLFITSIVCFILEAKGY